MSKTIAQKNNRLIRQLLMIVFGMFAFGYALVPLYDVFCDLTGINGKTNAVAVADTLYKVDKNREINIEFISSVNKFTPMIFKSLRKKIKVHPGQYYTVNFYAKNKTNKAMIARAIPSITPGPAAQYFKKTECFCFSQQTFKAHEAKTMPVRFVIDPALPAHYTTLTLAYTFFDTTEKLIKK